MSDAGPPARPDDSEYSEIAETADQLIDPANDARLVGRFYRGLIVFLDRARGRGTVRSFSGREIRFEFPFVAVLGAPIGGRAPGIDLIRQGDTVGFDVGWTSKGLRVTRIKPLRSL